MMKLRWGRVINISSTGGLVGDKGTLLYSSSNIDSKKNEMEFKNYVSHITSFYNSFRHFLCRYKVFTKLLKKEVFTKEGGTTQ